MASNYHRKPYFRSNAGPSTQKNAITPGLCGLFFTAENEQRAVPEAKNLIDRFLEEETLNLTTEKVFFNFPYRDNTPSDKIPSTKCKNTVRFETNFRWIIGIIRPVARIFFVGGPRGKIFLRRISSGTGENFLNFEG